MDAQGRGYNVSTQDRYLSHDPRQSRQQKSSTLVSETILISAKPDTMEYLKSLSNNFVLYLKFLFFLSFMESSITMVFIPTSKSGSSLDVYHNGAVFLLSAPASPLKKLNSFYSSKSATLPSKTRCTDVIRQNGNICLEMTDF